LFLARQGKTAEAITRYREALRLQPDLIEAPRNLAWIRAAQHDPQYRDGGEAVRLAERTVRLTQEQDAGALDALAAAYAEAGRFAEASATARQAQAAAAAQGKAELAQEIQRRLALYNANRPYREEEGSR
jgi:Flp pilus assembly protein TadD